MSDRPEKSATIVEVCSALLSSGPDAARSVLERDYKFDPEPVIKRQYGPVESMRVFIRDGFIDRYTGTRVIFPPVFRILSLALPVDFPYHPAWKTELTHPAYWELGATIDHLTPVTRGGLDDPSNWITASMASNSAKMNWTLDELGWSLHAPGDIREWDGLTGWFLDYSGRRPEVLTGRIRQWNRAAKLALAAV